MENENNFGFEIDEESDDENIGQYVKGTDNATYLLNPVKYIQFCKAVKLAKELCDSDEGIRIFPIDPKKQMDANIKLYSPMLIMRDNKLQKYRQLIDIVDCFDIYCNNSLKIIILFKIQNMFIKL